MNYYEAADAALAVAQMLVAELRKHNDDSDYGLLESAYTNIIGARADLDADQK